MTTRKYYLKNREEILRKNKDYYLKNKETMGGRSKEYKSKKRESVIAYHKQYYQENIEDFKYYSRDHYLKNRKEILRGGKEKRINQRFPEKKDFLSGETQHHYIIFREGLMKYIGGKYVERIIEQAKVYLQQTCSLNSSYTRTLIDSVFPMNKHND